MRAGVISHPLDITDAWKNSYSCSTNHKVWAAKFTARHPNLVALEISSFKCGHDAPIYGVIEGIIEQSGTPYFCFKDLDENKPSGSIRIPRRDHRLFPAPLSRGGRFASAKPSRRLKPRWRRSKLNCGVKTATVKRREPMGKVGSQKRKG